MIPLNPHKRWAARLRLAATIVLFWLAILGAMEITCQATGSMCRW